MPPITLKNSEQQEREKNMYILFGSKTRFQILKLFFSNPNNAYYVRELSRLIKMQVNAIRRELANLEKIGIISVNKTKPIEKDLEDLKSGKIIRKGIKGVEPKYYQLNKDFILYNELKNLFIKMKGVTKETLISNISKLGNVVFLLLSGIFVNDKDSAIDLLVVGDIDSDELRKVIQEFNDSIGKDINYTLLTEEEFNYRQEVVDRFLYNILQNRKNQVIIDKRNLNLK